MSQRDYREEIEAALNMQAPPNVPFTSYVGHIPAGRQAELAARGLAVCSSAPVWKESTPNVNLKIEHLPDATMRVTHQTPVGEVWKLQKQTAGGSWGILEFYIKRPEDYKVAEFIFSDRRYEPCYEEFEAARRKMGDAGIVLTGGGYSPLIELQLVWLGQELFCYDMADRPDDIMRLYGLLWRNQQRMMQIVADSPARHVQYCGNIVGEMIGPANVEKHILPCFQAWSEAMHSCGKKMGSHLDGRNGCLLDFIRASGLDYIEAFTPAPDTDLTVAQARRELPGKVIWANFPSSVHLADKQTIRRTTEGILRDAGDRKGFLLGITEDVPADRAFDSFNTILDVLDSARE